MSYMVLAARRYLLPLLQRLLHGGAIRIRRRTIQHAMIIAEAERTHGQEGESIAYVRFQRMAIAHYDRSLLNHANAENTRLALRDDWRLKPTAGRAIVG